MTTEGTKPARDAKGRLLPGQTANPSGQPKAFAEVRKLLEKAVPGALDKLIELVGHEDPKVALAASRDILDRTLGKAKESVEVKTSGNVLLAELLAEIAAARRRPDPEDDNEP